MKDAPLSSITNQQQLSEFLKTSNLELEETLHQNQQIISDTSEEYNLLCIDFEEKFGVFAGDGDIIQFENQLFILNNLFEAKEKEIIYLENFYNNITIKDTKLPFEYYDIQTSIINQTYNINLNELRGSYSSLSKQIINIKSKNESVLGKIKVWFLIIRFY